MSSASISIYTELLLSRDQLVQGLMEQKSEFSQWAQDVSATTVNIQTTLDLSSAQSAIDAFRDLQEAEPIVIPLIFDAQSAMDAIGTLKGVIAESGGMAGYATAVASGVPSSIAAAETFSASGPYGLAGAAASSGSAYSPAPYGVADAGTLGAWGPGAGFMGAMAAAQYGNPMGPQGGVSGSYAPGYAGGFQYAEPIGPEPEEEEEGGGFFKGSMGMRGLHSGIFAAYAIDKLIKKVDANNEEATRDIGGDETNIRIERKQIEDSLSTPGRVSRWFQKKWSDLDPHARGPESDDELKTDLQNLNAGEKQIKADEADKRQNEVFNRNSRAIETFEKKEDKEISEAGLSPKEKLRASIEDTFKESNEFADKIIEEQHGMAGALKAAKEAAGVRSRAAELRDIALTALGNDQFAENNIEAASTRGEVAGLNGDVVGQQRATVEAKVQREYKQRLDRDGAQAAGDWLANVGTPQIAQAGAQAGLSEDLKDLAEGRKFIDIFDQANENAQRAKGSGYEHGADRSAYVRSQNDAVDAAYDSAEAVKSTDSREYARRKDLADEQSIAAKSNISAYDANYNRTENDKYQHLQISGEQDALRASGRGAEADVLGLRENISKLENDAGGDAKKLAVVNAYAHVEAQAMRKQLTDSAPSQYGLDDQSYQRNIQEQIDRGAGTKSALNQLNKLESDVNRSGANGPIDAGGAVNWKDVGKDLAAGAKKLADLKPVYVVGGSNG